MNQFNTIVHIQARLWYLFTVAIILSSCANEVAWEEEVTAPAPLAVTPSIRAQVTPGEEPNEYAVNLEWGVPSSGKAYLISRTDKNSRHETFSVSSKTPNAFTDTSAVPGDTYHYAVHYMADGVSHQIEAPSVEVPKDLSLSGLHEISSMKVGRLYLEESAMLVTNGKAVQIDADEIVSEGAAIMAFFEIGSAKDEASKHPGAIRVNARSAKGTLLIDASGKPGPDGRNGKDGATGLPGDPGIDGHDTINPVFKTRLTQSAYDAECTYFEKNQATQQWTEAERAERSADKYWEFPKHVCAVQPTDGKKGGTGNVGEDAGDGEKGGDSASVHVNILQNSEFKVIVLNETGPGGRPGRAGNGGAGGPGGAAGKRDFLRLGRIANDGPTGESGQNGKPGRQGASGAAQPCFVKIGEKIISDTTKASP